MLKAPLLLAAVLVVCVASSADARRRHHGYYGGYGERNPSSFDDWRRARETQGQGQDRGQGSGQDQVQDQRQEQNQGQSQDQNQNRGQAGVQDRSFDRTRERGDRRRVRSLDEWRRSRDTQNLRQDLGRAAKIAPARPTTAGVAAMTTGGAPATKSGARAMRIGGAPASARIGRGGARPSAAMPCCAAAAGRSAPWSRSSSAAAASRAPSSRPGRSTPSRRPSAPTRRSAPRSRRCASAPRRRPSASPPTARRTCPRRRRRLEAVEQGIDAALAAFDTVEPALATFYGTLDDEQKARLYRDYSSRRERWRAYAAAREAAAREPTPSQARSQAAAPGWSGAMCDELAAVLRGWPVREIERDVRLSSPQRVAFYELVTASLKAADTLGGACPAETTLTPVGRMDAMRKRLAAVRAATAAIRPALTHFYEALDQGQKVRFAGMS